MNYLQTNIPFLIEAAGNYSGCHILMVATDNHSGRHIPIEAADNHSGRYKGKGGAYMLSWLKGQIVENRHWTDRLYIARKETNHWADTLLYIARRAPNH